MAPTEGENNKDLLKKAKGLASTAKDKSLGLVSDDRFADLVIAAASKQESVNKVLSSFRDQGLIAVDGQEITILDRARLEDRIAY